MGHKFSFGVEELARELPARDSVLKWFSSRDAARDSLVLRELLNLDTDGTRLEMLEAGCNSLLFYAIPTG